MEIVRLNRGNLADINTPNELFAIIGRLKPSFTDGKWSWTEELYDRTVLKRYPNDDCDYAAYLDNPDKAVFLAYADGKCAGQIVLRKDWNRYAFIEDICVSASYRGNGIGTALIQKAVQWAKEKGLCGLALETQDNNLLACRFYAKCGFSVGAVNTMLYKNFEKPWSDETAIFWYMKFSP